MQWPIRLERRHWRRGKLTKVNRCHPKLIGLESHFATAQSSAIPQKNLSIRLEDVRLKEKRLCP
jgi:hypothetical protein